MLPPILNISPSAQKATTIPPIQRKNPMYITTFHINIYLLNLFKYYNDLNLSKICEGDHFTPNLIG
jgi:hypothetical protein